MEIITYPNKLPITATIITYNEENNIEHTLKSLNICNEIILVDSCSSDKTVNIAMKYTNNIYIRKFDNFANQRNFAISKANNDWILRIDADEILTEQLQKKIYDIYNKDDKLNKNCYCVKQRYKFMDKYLKYSHVADRYVKFLYNTKQFKFERPVHEHVDVSDWNVINIPEYYMLHDTFKNLESYKNKLDKYANLRIKQYLKNQKKINYFHIYIKPIWRFIFHYFIHLGILDGKPGFLFASLQSYEVKIRYKKYKKIKNESICNNINI